MPELPEVEHARTQAAAALSGRRIKRVRTVADSIVYAGVSPRRFAQALTGRTVKVVDRKGKQLWFELDRRPWPTFHFGMTGSFRVYRDPAERPRFWKLEIEADDGTHLAMVNKRRLGRIRLLNDPIREPPIAGLGFDPLYEMPGLAAFTKEVLRRHTPIKALLLDQAFAAGIGNWIADEVLYRARIAPHRRANELTAGELRALHSALRYVIGKAVSVDADADRFPRTWLFHHRWGKNPDARTTRGEFIRFDIVAGRTSAWVPSRQQ